MLEIAHPCFFYLPFFYCSKIILSGYISSSIFESNKKPHSKIEMGLFIIELISLIKFSFPHFLFQKLRTAAEVECFLPIILRFGFLSQLKKYIAI